MESELISIDREADSYLAELARANCDCISTYTDTLHTVTSLAEYHTYIT